MAIEPLPPPTPVLPPALPLMRTRVALAMISLVGVALELALMRALALRFYSNFSSTIISVGLLGFSAAGSLITLFRKPVMLPASAVLLGPRPFSGCQHSCHLVAGRRFPAQRPLSRLGFLPIRQRAGTRACACSSPSCSWGAFVCVALMDRPERISGHYASDLLGSGTGSCHRRPRHVCTLDNPTAPAALRHRVPRKRLSS